MAGLFLSVCVIFGVWCEDAPQRVEIPPKSTPAVIITNDTINVLVSREVVPDYSGIDVRCLFYREPIQSVSAEPSRLAAQLEQESGCRPFAKSKYAHGLMQFTPSTAKWAGKTICVGLGRVDLYSPAWSIGCGAKYMDYLLGKNQDVTDACDQRKIAERAYNGGQGWVNREKRRADQPYTYANLSAECPNTGRAGWACDENLGYAPHISRRQPKYRDYGGAVCLN